MNSLNIPNQIINEIDSALENLNSPLALSKSLLLSSRIVVNRNRENPAELPYQSLKAVLTEVLFVLAEENPDHADILRGRFWEGLSPTNMIVNGRPQQWSEKTFYNHQKKARQEFYTIFWQREQNDSRYPVAGALASPGGEQKTTQRKQMGIRPAWFYTGLLLLALAGISFLISFLPKDEPASQQVAEPTSAPTTLPENLPDNTPTALSPAAFCGEVEEIPIDLGIPRFVRSQGISNFNTGNTPGILSNTVRALAIAPTGVWIGYFDSDESPVGGLGHFNKKRFANCGFPESLEQKNINAIAVSQAGKIWVGLEKNGVLSFDGENWQLYTKKDGLPSDEIFSLTVDAQDNLWVGTWEGVAKFDGSNWSVPYQAENDTIFNNRISAIAFDAQQNIWVGHIRDGVSLYRQAEGRWVHLTADTESGLAGNEIREILVRPAGEGQPESIWFATADGGISRLEQDEWTVYREETGLPGNEVSDLILDRFNRVWAATSKGVAYFDNNAWKIYTTLETTTLATGGSCPDATCPYDDEHIWTGSPAMGLTHSRIPLPDAVIHVTSVCFVTMERERICPPFSLDTSVPLPVVTAIYPFPLKPGEKLRFEITVSPEGVYELRDDRGDFLSNTDPDDFNLFGAWPIIGVKEVVVQGQPYTFTDFDNPFIAPELPADEQEAEFTSTWRIWMRTRYVGPYIRLAFRVANE